MIAKKQKVENIGTCGKCGQEKDLTQETKANGKVCEDCYLEKFQIDLPLDEYDLQPGEMTKEQFAEKAGVSLRNIEIWKSKGLIEAKKLRRRVGGVVRSQLIFQIADVEKYLNKENEPVNLPKVEKMDAIQKTNENENSFSNTSQVFVFGAIEQITENLKAISMNKQLSPGEPEQKPRFLTLQEVTDEFRLSKTTIKNLIESKKLTEYKGNHGKVLVSRKEIESL